MSFFVIYFFDSIVAAHPRRISCIFPRSSGVAFEKEYYTMESPRTRNIRSVSVRHKGLNQKVERLNGIFRDRERVMHGLDHAESAQKTIEAFRIHYNFIREHGSIKKTPAEEAGIKLPLGQNKIENYLHQKKEMVTNLILKE